MPLYLRSRYESRYALLGQMSDEIADAFRSAGHPVSSDEPVGTEAGLYIWLNFLQSIEALPRALRSPDARVGLVHFFVDHPYALDEALMDELVALPNYRLLLPCSDGAHLLGLRWPALKHKIMLHGVPSSAVCSPDACESGGATRETDLIITGSIDNEVALFEKRSVLPQRLQGPADEMVEMMFEQPWMPFEQAYDVVFGARGVATGEWRLASAVWRFVIAAVNRCRRISIVTAMQGIETEVWGAPSWEPHCTGSVRYRGSFEYSDSPRILAGAKVALAWGPTQFTHAFSERALLAMAAGCATVVDDRLLVRSRLGDGVERFDAADPVSANRAVRVLLDDHDRRAGLAGRGRAIVERAHLWSHRVPHFVAAAEEAIRTPVAC